MSVFWSISFKMAVAQNVTEHMLTQKSIEVHCVWLYNKCHKINLHPFQLLREKTCTRSGLLILIDTLSPESHNFILSLILQYKVFVLGVKPHPQPSPPFHLPGLFNLYLIYTSVMCSCLVSGYFSPNYKLTIGVDFALKVIYWDEKTKINLQLW